MVGIHPFLFLITESKDVKSYLLKNFSVRSSQRPVLFDISRETRDLGEMFIFLRVSVHVHAHAGKDRGVIFHRTIHNK